MTAVTYAADVSDQLGDVQPHVVRAANLIANALGITEMTGYGQRSGKSDHPRGLAIDIPATGAGGDAIAKFVTANASALGVKYVIWQQRIWRPGGTWEAMATQSGDTGSGYDPNHVRHVHVSFTDAPPAESDASALERLLSTVTAPVRWGIDTLGGVVRGTADAINPLDGWAAQAMAIGLKIAGVVAGLALVVLGVNRLVAPAVAGAVDKVVEVAT